MIDPEKILSELQDVARREATPPIDVRGRVMQTLSQPSQMTRQEFVLPAFAGVAVISAIVTAILALPVWQEIMDPWSLFFFN